MLGAGQVQTLLSNGHDAGSRDMSQADQGCSLVLPNTSFHNGSMVRSIEALICTPCARPGGR